MAKFNLFKRNGKRLLTLGFIPVLAITLTSCSSNNLVVPNSDTNYLTVGNYSVTNSEVWNSLKWSASDLFSEYIEEVVLQEKINEIETVLADANNENYNSYVSKLQNYIIEDVYDFEFSLEDHEQEIEDLLPSTREQNILEYADTIYVNNRVDISRADIATALRNEDYAALEPIYHLYYHDLASQLFALDKLNEEINDADEEALNDDNESTVGYFSKSEIVTKFEDSYYNQGDTDVIMIRFASEGEMNNTLRSFGIYVHNDKFYYLTNTPESYNEYISYYNDFDFSTASTDEYFDLDASYGHSIILQLYIAMYNYVYPYRSPIYNYKDSTSSFINNTTIDQRSVTKSMIDFYQANNLVTNADSDDARLDQIVTAAKTESNEFITYTAESLNDLDASLYEYIYETLQTPAENTYNDNTDDRYSVPSTAYASDNYQYMVFKISQTQTEDDKIADEQNTYNLNLSTDEKYNIIITNEALLNSIKNDLRDEDLTSSYISTALSDATANVEVSIFDQAMEISYSVNNSDYNRTLSGAPDNNTAAIFRYEDREVRAYITTEDKTGLWDVLEYRNGLTIAANLISTKMIKDTEEYKSIPQDIVDNFYTTIEYLLASFANNGLSSNGYPSSIGKYNFLMLYYHTADIDQIVNDTFKVSYVTQNILTDYSSDNVVNFFNEFSTKAYNNYFSITAQQVSVYMDRDEDGDPDDISTWQNEPISDTNQTTYGQKAIELIQKIYELIETSTSSHTDALTTIVDNYNSSSRYNPHEGSQYPTNGEDGYYDPIGNEWDFSQFKVLGFALTTTEVTVTNTSTDVTTEIKDALYNIYHSEGFVLNDNYPSSYLPEPTNTDTTVVADDSYNYFVITAASGPTSAKYEASDDADSLYQNLYYMYNERLIKVDNVYNDSDILNNNQIKAYLLEYVNSQTSNLLPSAISESVTNYLAPVLARFQENGTQYVIVINYICGGDLTKLEFNDPNNRARLEETLEINANAADQYIDYGDNAEVYNNFYGWWDSLSTLLSGGNN